VIITVDIREWQPGRRTGIGWFLEEFVRVPEYWTVWRDQLALPRVLK